MRPVLAGLALLLAASAAAQPVAGLEPGARVRIAYPAGTGPDGTDVVTGTLRSAGDTLVVETGAGAVLRPRAAALAGVEVGDGGRPFPSWMVTLGTALGAGAGVALAQTIPDRERCYDPGRGICQTERSGERIAVVAFATVVGAGVSTFLAVRASRERWVPVGELSAGPRGLSWRVGL